MDATLIQFFKAAVPGAPAVADPARLQADASKCGFLIHPDLLNTDLEAFVARQTADPNSTFYKRWQDVQDKDRFALFLDQIMHYTSTYGAGFAQEGNGWVPNDGAEAPYLREYTVIVPMTEEELYNRCLALLQGGAALKTETVQALCSAVTDHLGKHPGTPFDIDRIRNREALSILCKALGRRPSAPVDLLRYIVYETTHQTLLVKSQEMLGRIRMSGTPFDFRQLSQAELEGLASIFYRFKKLLLAFRYRQEYDFKLNAWVMRPTPNRAVINRLRRLATKRHVPMQTGFWECLLSADVTEEELTARLDSVSNFKLVRLLQAIRERLLLQEGDPVMYIIRNGSVWLKDAPAQSERTEYLKMLERVLHARLVKNLSAKACSVRFPGELTLTCPASEKTFVGNFPFGSCYPLSDHNFFGIYWRAEWGCHDFDISFVDWEGGKTGWNAEYNTGETLYSGDMTEADPEAAELLYVRGGCPDGTVFCNRYFGQAGSRFRFYFGRQEIADVTENYMVDPNAKVVDEELVSDRQEQMLAIVCGGWIYLCDLSNGSRRVSGGKDAGRKEAVMARKAHCFLSLRELLLEAGFTEASENPELDLTRLKKDTLLRLFALEEER